MPSSTPFVSTTCSLPTPRNFATNASFSSRCGYLDTSSAVSAASFRNTRGEQPAVFSFMFMFRPVSPAEGERYAFMVFTAGRASSIADPHADGFRMCFQPLCRRQRLYDVSDLSQPRARDLLHGDDLDVVHH